MHAWGRRRSSSERQSTAFQKMPSTSFCSASSLRSSGAICNASASHSFLLKLNTITCAHMPAHAKSHRCHLTAHTGTFDVRTADLCSSQLEANCATLSTWVDHYFWSALPLNSFVLLKGPRHASKKKEKECKARSRGFLGAPFTTSRLQIRSQCHEHFLQSKLLSSRLTKSKVVKMPTTCLLTS